jgi:hypothetical protein
MDPRMSFIIPTKNKSSCGSPLFAGNTEIRKYGNTEIRIQIPYFTMLD